METNLLFQLVRAPEILQKVVVYLEPHNLCKITRTAKDLCIPPNILIQCRTDTQAKYCRPQRTAEGSLRFYSEFGKQTYDISVLNEKPKTTYLMRSTRGLFRGIISRGTALFNANEIETLYVRCYDDENDPRILILAKLNFPAETGVTTLLIFKPCNPE
jgi:hypothetical protein